MQTGGIVSPDNLAKVFLNIQVWNDAFLLCIFWGFFFDLNIALGWCRNCWTSVQNSVRRFKTVWRSAWIKTTRYKVMYKKWICRKETDLWIGYHLLIYFRNCVIWMLVRYSLRMWNFFKPMSCTVADNLKRWVCWNLYKRRTMYCESFSM